MRAGKPSLDVPCFILGSGLISPLKAQAAEWARKPSPSTKYQGLTLRQDTVRAVCVGVEYTRTCACSWQFCNYQGVYCVCVWRPSASAL